MDARPSFDTDSAAPTPAPSQFRKLWAATAASNLGDGAWLVAAPLLALTLTRDPVLIAGLAFAQRLPWLLFGLIGGALADRLDRRRVMVGVAAARATLVGTLTVAVVFDWATMPLLYIVFFLIAVGETLFDTSAAALLPALVPKENLTQANARLSATFTITNQFIGPPLGGSLFAAAAALPFALGAAGLAATSTLLSTLRGSFRADHPPDRPRTSLRADIAEGVRWLRAHRLLRTLTIAMAILNLTLVAQVSITVLLAEERLGLGPAGYGALVTAYGVGGVLGGLVAPWVLARIGESQYLRLAIILETAIPAAMALTTSGYVAGAVFVLFGLHAIVWGSLISALQQELTPDRLRGRVRSVNAVLEYGTGAPGALLGGLLASTIGITAPFWLGVAAGVVLIPATWMAFSQGSLAEARAGDVVSLSPGAHGPG